MKECCGMDCKVIVRWERVNGVIDKRYYELCPICGEEYPI